MEGGLGRFNVHVGTSGNQGRTQTCLFAVFGFPYLQNKAEKPLTNKLKYPTVLAQRTVRGGLRDLVPSEIRPVHTSETLLSTRLRGEERR